MIPEKKIKHEIKLPEGVKATYSEDGMLTLEGQKGKVSKKILNSSIKIKVEGNMIKFNSEKLTRNEKALANTFRAHIKNMIKGAQEGYTYKLKVCSTHFPMTAALEGSKVVVKNLFGEKTPRKANIIAGVKVDIQGDIITLTGCDKEAVGQTAANLEQSTRITNKDRRVFVDGIWITDKAGEHIR